MIKRKSKFIKRLFYSVAFLFSVALFLWNCDKEDHISNHQHQLVSKHITKTTFTDFLEDPKFKDFNKKHNLAIYTGAATLLKANTESFVINENNVKKIDYGTSTSYNFYIERATKEQHVVENLVVVKTKDMTTAFIMKYTYKNTSARSTTTVHQELDEVEINPVSGGNEYQLNEFLKNHYLGGSGYTCRMVRMSYSTSCVSGDHNWQQRNDCVCYTQGYCLAPKEIFYEREVCEPNQTINLNDSNNDPNSSGVGGSNDTGNTNPSEYDAVTEVVIPEDIDDKIINELTGKAKCVYDKLNSLSTGFKDAIKKFDGDFPVSHLNLNINNDLTSGNYGRTYPPDNFIINIEFSNTQLSKISNLGSAVAIAHEIIHAEIFRKMLSAAKKGDLDPNNMTKQELIDYISSLRNNFPGLYDYYIKRYKPTWNHNMMAQHYKSVIADIVEEYDNKSLPRQVYEDISWAGLRIINNPVTNGTETSIAWDNLSSDEQSRIKTNLSKYFNDGAKNCN